MVDLSRDPLFKLDDIHDLTKDQIRERTMAKLYVPLFSSFPFAYPLMAFPRQLFDGPLRPQRAHRRLPATYEHRLARRPVLLDEVRRTLRALPRCYPVERDGEPDELLDEQGCSRTVCCPLPLALPLFVLIIPIS